MTGNGTARTHALCCAGLGVAGVPAAWCHTYGAVRKRPRRLPGESMKSTGRGVCYTPERAREGGVRHACLASERSEGRT
jgi:hypothetical protein